MKQPSKKILSWEAHLIERASDGESVAFDLLADLYRPALQSLAMRMLRDPDDAKDAVQDTFVKAFRAIHEFDPNRPIKPWLCRICTNCCIDTVRAKKNSAESIEQHEYMLADTGPMLEDRAASTIRQKLIIEAISRLPDKYRDILLMRHFKHMDVIEIAHALNKPEGTIKSWLFRARALLKKDLQVVLN